MNQIKAYFEISMSTGFIFVQNNFWWAYFLEVLFTYFVTKMAYILKKPLSMNATERTVGAQSVGQASTYFVL